MKRYLYFLAALIMILTACSSQAPETAAPAADTAFPSKTASPAPAEPAESTATPTAAEMLSSPTATGAPPTAAATETPEPTLPPPTNTPPPEPVEEPTPTDSLGIGSTHISPITGMVWVYVPSGEFTRGSSADDPQALADEQPQTTVALDGFWIDQTEVTNAMFAVFLNDQGDRDEEGTPWLGQDVPLEQDGDTWVPVSGYEDHPVTSITWYAASAYCAWAGGRLPTEAEWEKAARGTDGGTYPWGDDPAPEARLNFADSSSTGLDWANPDADDGYARTSPAGSYPDGASPYLALDLAGNVWEWASDWYGDNYYAEAPASSPPGPDDGSLKIIRGGSWQDPMAYVRTAYRGGVKPDSTLDIVGFRCAAETLPAPPNPFSDLPHATLRTTEYVGNLSWSPDGDYLAAGGGGLFVWSIEAKDFFYTRVEKRSVSGTDYSPDGYLLATSYSNSGLTHASVVLWGAQSGSPRQELRVGGGHALHDVTWSPDGSFLVSAGSSGQVFVWDAATWERIAVLDVHDKTAAHNDLHDLAVSPDGGILAASSINHVIYLWDTTTWEQLAVLEGHTRAVTSLAWSPDRALLASGSSDDRIFLWDTTTWEITQILELENNVPCLSWSPDGRLLASTNGQDITLWEFPGGERLGELSAHKDWVIAVAFSPDGRILASGSSDDTMILWYLP